MLTPACTSLSNQLESSQYVFKRDTEYIIHVAADRSRCYVFEDLLLLFIITASDCRDLYSSDQCHCVLLSPSGFHYLVLFISV